ncbi:glycosyltransferase [Desulforamulus ruminis]|uniref:Glycosyltransferase-like protein n=1 Tax=Desulforamulus ruminis (strain ATCC 23193 / DSM 2154 / NCIMB 8452 / DL) TaxID=696281 RepID=F6DS74_DESRL|nr:glycosyltransferase [Desulforamulus ruminis]AEG58836.1 glycosyltransferase-like protein [Desulforamulus ruminis DSM 2154]
MVPVIVYPPTVDWDYLHQRPQQLLKALSRCGCPSVFCNLNLEHRHTAGFQSVDENLILANQVDLPEAVQYAKQVYPGYPVVIYYTSPLQVQNIHPAQGDLVVFDSIDEPVCEFAHWFPNYDQAVKKADLVIASARSLVSRAGFYRGDGAFLIPNGCDYEHFSQAQTRHTVNEFPFTTGKPLIGYIGAMATWLDWPLIDTLAHRLHNYEFVFIGPLHFGKPPVQAPNVHYLGHREYRDLPFYLSNFSFCLIPLRLNQMTAGVNPIKFWEYLASGIPILSTELPEVDPDYVVTIRSESLPDIKRIKSKKGKEDRIALARLNSWHERAKKLLTLIQGELKKHG